MANNKKHLQQYEDNKRVFSSDFFAKEENLDWKVTIIFYAAIHLIESKIPTEVPCNSHKDRYNIIQKSYIRIIDPYDNLYKLSIKARYKCIKVKNRDVISALTSLLKIEHSMIV
jgi:hypothetical protein